MRTFADEVLGLQGHSHLDATPSRPLGTLNPQERTDAAPENPITVRPGWGWGSGRGGGGLGRGERGGLGEEDGFRGRREERQGQGMRPEPGEDAAAGLRAGPRSEGKRRQAGAGATDGLSSPWSWLKPA